ncbi:hypothetical protein [Flavobacterium sp.]|uniref:hypothetical protein n=1 Tax=Flavobacterium sp. TaxID=239 RepID=UPI003D6ADB29
MKKIKLALAIIVIIAGLGTIMNRSLFGGLLMLMLGVIILPIVSSELSARFEFWNKKPFRYTFYILLFLFSAGIANKKGLSKSKKDKLVVTDSVVKENVEIKSETEFEYKICDYGGDDFYIIPDMIAADIYPNFENKGFKIDKQIKSDHTSIYCGLSLPNGKFSVVITGCSPEEIIEIEATAIDNSGNNQKEVEAFLEYVAASQYKNSEPEKAREWIKNNFDTDGASAVIGGVTFSINFKSIHSKFLRMEIKKLPKSH